MAFFPTQKTLEIAGRTFISTEIDRFESGTTGVILYGHADTADRWATLRLANGTTGFQVPSGKTLTIKAMIGSSAISTSWGGFQPLYGDNDVGQNSTTAPTNAVYLAGNGTGGMYQYHLFQNGNSSGLLGAELLVNFTVPQLKYPAIQIEAAIATCVVYCFID